MMIIELKAGQLRILASQFSLTTLHALEILPISCYTYCQPWQDPIQTYNGNGSHFPIRGDIFMLNCVSKNFMFAVLIFQRTIQSY